MQSKRNNKEGVKMARIMGRSKFTGECKIFYDYDSIEQCKKHNPGFNEFEWLI